MLLILPFIVALIITTLFIPLTIRLAHRFSLVDDPQKRPHPAHTQNRIIPRAGGLAIYLGIIIASLLLLPMTKSLIGITVGCTVLLLMGLADDKVRTFNPYLRLFLLFLAAGCAVASGIGISFINNPFAAIFHLSSDSIIRLDSFLLRFDLWGPHTIVLFADIVAFVWIVTLTQVINWAKGVDGQMPGITLITSLTLGIFSYRLFLQGDPHQLSIAQLSFIVAGSSLGFLFFNWHPARILPGFSGSTILAFVIAILAILSGAKLAVASLTLAIPVIDFIYTFWRRVLQGKSPVWGDRGHLHHKLLDLGWSHQQISLFYMLGSAILGTIALFVDSQSKLFAIITVAVIFFVFILWINSFGGLSEQSDQDNG